MLKFKTEKAIINLAIGIERGFISPQIILSTLQDHFMLDQQDDFGNYLTTDKQFTEILHFLSEYYKESDYKIHITGYIPFTKCSKLFPKHTMYKDTDSTHIAKQILNSLYGKQLITRKFIRQDLTAIDITKEQFNYLVLDCKFVWVTLGSTYYVSVDDERLNKYLLKENLI